MIKLIVIGKHKSKELQQLCLDYLKKMKPFVNISCIEGKQAFSHLEPKLQLKAEQEWLLKHIHPQDFVIALAIEGQQKSSLEFAKELALWQAKHKRLVFIIGGDLGLSVDIKQRANVLLSFSRFTFTHLMARLLLLEQLYRSFMINNHRNYHK